MDTETKQDPQHWNVMVLLRHKDKALTIRCGHIMIGTIEPTLTWASGVNGDEWWDNEIDLLKEHVIEVLINGESAWTIEHFMKAWWEVDDE